MDPELMKLRIFLLIENTSFADGYLFLRIWYDKIVNEFVFKTSKKGRVIAHPRYIICILSSQHINPFKHVCYQKSNQQ